jgi:hypothetical protein
MLATASLSGRAFCGGLGASVGRMDVDDTVGAAASTPDLAGGLQPATTTDAAPNRNITWLRNLTIAAAPVAQKVPVGIRGLLSKL